MADHSSPISVQAPGIFTQVSAGLNSGYGLREDGRVFAWGDNSGGQLGDNSLTQRNTPVIIAGAHQFNYIAAGWNHILGIAKNGSAWAWGSSEFGQLGDGSTAPTSASSPVSVVGDHEFIKVDAGECHSIGLKADGTVWVWGCNTGGQLGAPPFEIGAIGGWYYGSFAIDRITGYMWVWGQDAFGTGQTGTNTIANYSSPVTVAGPQGWAADTRHLVDQSWGNPDDYGDFGGFDHPCDVIGNCKGVFNMEGNSAIAIKQDGSVWCWGDGTRGNLGQGGGNWETNYSSPRSVVGTGPGEANEVFWSATKAGNASYGLNQYGTLYAWGDVQPSMTGFNSINSPVDAIGYMVSQCPDPCTHPLLIKRAVRQIDCSGDGNKCIILDWQGEAYTWGYGNGTQCDGQYSLGEASPNPVLPPPIGGGWKMTSAGLDNVMMLDGNGDVWMCGYNPPEHGMSPPWFGGGGPTARSTPTIVLGSPHSAIKVRTADSDGHFAFLRADGSLWTWGSGGDGTLGVGDLLSRTSPTSVLGSGQSYSFVDFEFNGEGGMVAIDSTGQVWGWGPWTSVGDNTTSTRSFPTMTSLNVLAPETVKNSPVQVQVNPTLFSDIAAGDNHNLAMDTDNNVWAWGDNTSGQLGTGDTTSRTSPTLVTGLSTNIIDIAAGTQFSYVLDDEEDLWAWGDNTCGKLGDAVFPNWTGIGAGGQGYGAAIDGNTGYLWMWGLNISGQLGDLSKTNRSSPVTVKGPQGWGLYPPISSLATGPCNLPGNCGATGLLSDNMAWASKLDGSTWMWGDQGQGQMGVGGGYTTDYSSPKSVLGSGDNKFWSVVSTPGGPASTYFLAADGTLWVAGATTYIGGGLGMPSSINSPIDVEAYVFAARPADPFVGFIAQWISAGIFGGMVGNGATIFAWGSNAGGYDGRLCTGDVVNHYSPTQVYGGAVWLHGAHGAQNSILLHTTGNVYGCGDYASGLFGAGLAPPYPNNHISIPTVIAGAPHSAVMVRASQSAHYWGYLAEDGSIWMWGENTYGQLGTGDTASRTSPTSVLGSGQSYSFVDFVIGGQSGTVALDSEGRVWGWGQWGHVGDNTTTDKHTPTMTSVPAPAALPPYTTTPVQVYRPW